jgi:hypothetical protein
MGARAGAARAAMVVAIALCASSCHATHGADEAGAPDAATDAPGDAAATHGPAAEAGPPDDEMPPTSSEELTTRARHLLEAIAADDAELAGDMRFPRDGWVATRDAADTGKDWETRLAAPFRKAIHALSRKHKDLDRAQFATLELGHAIVQVTTRKHSWKKALWMVRGSRITFVVDGRTRTLTIAEMTGWRGAWYVTRLR